jgi:hypothetical protein
MKRSEELNTQEQFRIRKNQLKKGFSGLMGFAGKLKPLVEVFRLIKERRKARLQSKGASDMSCKDFLLPIRPLEHVTNAEKAYHFGPINCMDSPSEV